MSWGGLAAGAVGAMVASITAVLTVTLSARTVGLDLSAAASPLVASRRLDTDALRELRLSKAHVSRRVACRCDS